MNIMDSNSHAPQHKKSSANLSFIYLTIFLALTLIGSSYFIGSKLASKTSSSQPGLSLSLQKAQNSINTNSGVLTKTSVMQIYSGKITNIIPEKSWTLDKQGKVATITNEAGSKINYFIRSDGWTSTSIAATATPKLKLGDTIMIQTSILTSDDRVSVDKITQIIFPTASHTPTPTP